MAQTEGDVVQRVAAILVQELTGGGIRDVTTMRVNHLEKEVFGLTDRISLCVAESLLQAPADGLGEKLRCPCCRGELVKKPPRSKALLLRRGEAHWDEPVWRCLPCRRDFFPSVGGLRANWHMQRERFSHYTPVVDLMHAIAYVYTAAIESTLDMDESWQRYCRWMPAVWLGDVSRMLPELARLIAEMKNPECRSTLQDCHTYLSNSTPRMGCPEYRRQGLPITTALGESKRKQINRRVLGAEIAGRRNRMRRVRRGLGHLHRMAMAPVRRRPGSRLLPCTPPQPVAGDDRPHPAGRGVLVLARVGPGA